MSGILFKEMQRAQKQMDDDFKEFFEAPTKMLPKILPGKNIELFNEPMPNIAENAGLALAEMIKPNISLNMREEMLDIGAGDKRKSCHKALELPSKTNAENSDAMHENGLLRITLPKEPINVRKLTLKNIAIFGSVII